MQRVAIIGGGASGLAAAAELLKYPEHFYIQLFEKNAKLAKKIAATGNGHCNLSNADMKISAYQGDIEAVFEQIKTFDIEQFCADLGFLTRRQGLLYYPYSFQSHTVVNAFSRRLKSGGVQVLLNTEIVKIQKEQKQYILKDQNNRIFKADIVIVAGGGKAGPVFGSDGKCLEMLKKMHFQTAPLYPSLVQIKTKPALKQLKGCRFFGTFSLYENKTAIASYQGEALFTEDGISGIAVMQLSRLLHFELSNTYEIHCSFVDRLSKKEVYDYYICHRHDQNVYTGIVQEKLADYFNSQLTTDFEDFWKRLSDFTLNVSGTRGFDYAQVTRGGVLLCELDEHFMSKRYPNLYLCGEILNVDGDCGGYNLHFAFASGQAAAKNIIQRFI